ncbi:MAG: cytochrome c [Alphaproteobacteria bacterium]|nr:cytochrome c [Alphaproteobacteria bacterium]
MSKLQLLAVILFLVVGTGAIYVNTMDPPKRKGHTSTLPDMTGLEEGDPILKIKLPASFTPKEKLGKTAFEAVCAACHGINGAGIFGMAPPLVYIIYEPSHHGDFAFLNAAQNGVRSHHWPFGNMPPQKGLTKADITNLVAYIRVLQRTNGIN